MFFLLYDQLQDPQNQIRNRGFAFVLYYNNACADYSRQKMSSANFKLDGNSPTVSWADPKSTPDNSAASQVIELPFWRKYMGSVWHFSSTLKFCIDWNVVNKCDRLKDESRISCCFVSSISIAK